DKYTKEYNPNMNRHKYENYNKRANDNAQFSFDINRLTLNNGELNIAGDTGDIFDIDNNLLELSGNMA
ncbi:hypothetical protein IJO12_01605, partial [bacterium]|nr:hypothetical protein [bacterium]